MGRSGGRTHHELPVKGGLSLRYSLDDRWSVQTGVNYSYHSSEIEMGGEDIDQQLHFIGELLAQVAQLAVDGHSHAHDAGRVGFDEVGEPQVSLRVTMHGLPKMLPRQNRNMIHHPERSL